MVAPGGGDAHAVSPSGPRTPAPMPPTRPQPSVEIRRPGIRRTRNPHSTKDPAMPTTIQLPPAAPLKRRRLQARRAVGAAGGAASVLILAGGGFAFANHAMTEHDQ